MTNYKQCQNTKCSISPSGQCNGGQAFNIRDRMFCSPSCGNRYWGLKKGDEDYWPNYEDGDLVSDDDDDDDDDDDNE